MTRKTYTGEEIDVTFDLQRCIHSGKCLAGAPDVFDTDQKPWIQVGEADAEKVIQVVHQCPSGALRVQHKDGREAEQPDDQNTIQLKANGPLYVRGDLHIDPQRGEENEAPPEMRVALCRCGASENKPFCDNTHRKIEFRAGSSMAAEDIDKEKMATGTLNISPQPNGPLLLKGNFEIQDKNGQTLFQGEKAAFCRCGGSNNKPFCDGTHKTIGFTTTPKKAE